MPDCKACLQEVPKLVRCHIYPASMSQEAAGDLPALVSMSTSHGPRVSIAWDGIYDDNIVCADCEALFATADDYAIKFRRAALQLSIRFEVNHGTVAFPTFRADAAKLHTFALTTLFRASISDRWEHSSIRAPEIENEVRSTWRTTSTLATGRQVAIVVTRSDLGGYMAAPQLLNAPDHPVYVLQMPNFTFFIAASSAGLMPGFAHIALRPGNAVTVWRRRRPEVIEIQQPGEIINSLGNKVDRVFDSLQRKRRGVRV